ncbi:MAG: transcriptional regulator [Actinobacteria bacterium 13_2_20CM_2_71_6]|nr:MAG: transcriptional regulator [Actinobacteria bacterium 13_2_20CM_2_71_6]
MTTRRSPTVRRRRLGLELRRLREAAGITIDKVAERLECSSSKISRIETGHTGASPRDVRDMLVVYGVAGAAAEELVQVAREARQKGWWHLYGTVLTGAYVGLEAAASWICAYEAQVVPGLLQVAEYARTMICRARPDISEGEVERRVHVRMARQSLVTQDDPLRLWVVLDEAVFHRMVGGPTVMRRQLDHLAMVAELPNVTLQVLPFAAGAHAGMDGSFAILGYEDPADPDVVFAENAAGGLFLEKDEELRRYHFIFDHLRANALPPDRSVAFLVARAKEL